MIFEGWDDFKPEYRIMELASGVKVEIEQVNENNYKITQILSSNPQDYLRTDITPGKMIKSRPVLE